MDKRETIIATLQKRQADFHPVVHFDPAIEKIIALDFTAANTLITQDILNDIDSFSGYIDGQLQQNNARYGIGGYNEHRTIYKASKVFDGDTENEEPRRLHLGIDIWGKPLTAVMAPLDGIVHSFAFNNNFGDYGATIILSHRLDDISFFTLYGHLSLNSLKNLQEGQRIEKGETFCEFGIPIENGHWPPHLHFQLIVEIGNYKGDYPGVCKFSEREKWLMNSPDADLVLQLNRYI